MVSVLFRRRAVCLRCVTRMVIRLALIGVSLIWAMFLASPAWSQTCTGYRWVSTHIATGLEHTSYGPVNNPVGRHPHFLAFWAQHGVAIAQARFPDNATHTYSDFSYDPPSAGDGCSTSVRAISTQRSNGFQANVSGVEGCSTVTTNNICPPEEDECECRLGTASPIAGCGDRFTDSQPQPLNTCNPVTHCKMKKTTSISAGGVTIYTIEHSSEDCGPDDPDDEDDEYDRETCTTTAAGNEFCLSKDGENCGWLNGEFVCIPSTNNDGCSVFSDGGRLCGPNAPTPPVPDNGTPGNPAEPDDVFDVRDSQGNQTSYNYYNNTTVSNSNRPPGSSGDNPYDGDDDGSGKDGKDGPGGGGGNGLTCNPASDEGCNEGGDGEGEPGEGWQCWAAGDDFSSSVQTCFFVASQTLWDGLVDQSELLQAVTATVDAWPAGGGSCPSDTFSIGWVDETYDAWEVPCMFLSEVDDVLGPLFLLGWSLVGLRVLLTIPGGGE